MMTIARRTLLSLAALLFFLWSFGPQSVWAQPNTAQQLAFAGLRTASAQGQINGVKTDSAGNLYLLLDQKDGVRLLKCDNTGTTVLAQTLLGAKGDIGVALALDPAGDVYVTGTTTSTTFAATTGAAITARTDASTQSFVAKFDTALNTVFVSYTGASKIAAVALSATADAVFVTGVTYAANLPVTANGIQQVPANGSSGNGFVERFSASGSTLVYATYLTGAAGDTAPAAIVADSADNAYIAGETTATGFPTVAALVPTILTDPSGFLTKLSPAGDAITFSTFVSGAGLTSLALDSAGQSLLATGAVAPGQFPVDTVAMPLVPTTYQVLLRLPLDGSSVTSSTLIAPSAQSNVASATNGAAWIDGTLTAPLLPLTPLADIGLGYAVRVTSANVIDQTVRFGGLPTTNPAFASLPANITSIAVDPAGEPLIAGSVQPTASTSLLATETYDLPLRNAPTNVLPSALKDAEVTAASCSGSLCPGSAGYLAKVTPVSGAALSLSGNDLPFITVRNLGSSDAGNFQLATTAGMITSNCGTTLYAGGQCVVLLAGGSAGSLTVSATNATPQSLSFAAYSAPASTVVFSPKELDFGIATSTSAALGRTLTVTNLGSATQTFASANGTGQASPFSESASDCATSGSSKVLGAGGSCHITLLFTPFTAAASDGFQTGDWLVGGRSILLTGYSQAAALSASSSSLDFGTQFANGLRLPRYVYLSNSSTAPQSHAALALPSGSPFTLTDACPATLLPASVCRLRVDYLSKTVPSSDSVSLTLDGGIVITLTGATKPQAGVGGQTANPNLSVTPTTVTFANSVPVTGVSATTQTVAITNSGAMPFALSLVLTGDFTDSTSCATMLPAGQTCAVVLSFVPSQVGARQGLLSVSAGSGFTPVYVTLSGTATAIVPATNATLALGSSPVGQPVVQFYRISQAFTSLNATATGPYTLVLVEDTGNGPGSPSAATYSSTVTAACHNCFLGVRFVPSATGSQPGSLTLMTAANGSPYSLTLTGTGLATTGLVLTPAIQDFGSIAVHSASGSVLFTLSNLSSSGAAVTLSGPVFTGDFGLVAGQTGAQACSGSLAYGATCEFLAAFAPAASGSRTGSVTVGGVSATLTGTGAPDPGIALNPTGLTFLNVPGTTATSQTVTVTNTGASVVTVGAVSTGAGAFSASSSCGALAAGASCVVTVSFKPGSAVTADALSIPVSTASGGVSTVTPYTVALAGAYTATTAGLQVVPAQTLYGPVAVGAQGVSRILTVNNLTGKTLSLTTNLPRQFVLSGPGCTALAANGSCSFSVVFLPLTNGDIPGTISIAGAPSDGSASVNGIGYGEGFGNGQGTLTVGGALVVNGAYSFGQVTSGQTSTQVFTLSNLNAAGSAPITVRRVTSGPPFLGKTTCGQALAIGQSCTVSVTYSPSNQVAAGTASPGSTMDVGSLVIESDAASSPDTVTLTGLAGPLAVASPVNAAPIATFALSQSSLSFGATAVGNISAAQSFTLTNTGTATIHVSGLLTTGDFAATTGCGVVTPGTSCTISVTSTPQSTGMHAAALELVSDAAVSLEFVSLTSTGTPAQITLIPTALNFGSLLVGRSATQAVQVTNSGTTAVTPGAIAATGDYGVTGNCPAGGASLAAGASCSLQVTFTPTATGTRAGALSVANSASSLPLTVGLTGVGIQSQLGVAPGSLAFGSVAEGSSASLTVILTNMGSTAITNLALAVGGDYAISLPCSSTTLVAGESCTVQVTFAPTAVGTRAGSLTITSSDPGSPLVVPLGGTGVQAAGFALTVNGATAASVTVVSGNPASYQLALTPNGGFSGTVALTCSPVVAAQYATCSLSPSSLTLAGGGASGTATINTITSSGANAIMASGDGFRPILAVLALAGLLSLRRPRHRLRLFYAAGAAMVLLVASGCGGSTNKASAVLYAPAGTYQYTVTASSTSGSPSSQTVTLNLTVTSR